MHQLENGYTRIANTLLEYFSKAHIKSGIAFRIILWVIRNSYGYNRKETEYIGVRALSKEICSDIGNIFRQLNFLIVKNILGKNKQGGFFINKKALISVAGTHTNILYAGTHTVVCGNTTPPLPERIQSVCGNTTPLLSYVKKERQKRKTILKTVFTPPKIEEVQDKAIIEQSVDILGEIDSKIISIVKGGTGNQRLVELGIKKGIMTIDGENDKIAFEIAGKHVYTEPGENGQPGDYINVGDVLASTQKIGKVSTVTLISNYSGRYNIQFKGGETSKILTRAPVPYKILISNEGEVGGITFINFDLQ